MSREPAEAVGVTAPFYLPGDDGTVIPTPLAAGPPWVPETQHGSMVAALMARAVDACPVPTPMPDLTIMLSRPPVQGL